MAISSVSFQGSGVSCIPAAPPTKNLMKFLLLSSNSIVIFPAFKGVALIWNNGLLISGALSLRPGENLYFSSFAPTLLYNVIIFFNLSNETNGSMNSEYRSQEPEYRIQEKKGKKRAPLPTDYLILFIVYPLPFTICIHIPSGDRGRIS